MKRPKRLGFVLVVAIFSLALIASAGLFAAGSQEEAAAKGKTTQISRWWTNSSSTTTMR
jgi:hypothetical protein